MAGILLQDAKADYIPPVGFYVSTDNIFDDAKWSDAVYFEEQGFDQDVRLAFHICCRLVSSIISC